MSSGVGVLATLSYNNLGSRASTARAGGAGATGVTYAYDGLGRRIAKTVDGVTTEYLLDGDEEIAEYSGTGTLLRRYVYGPTIDDRIAMYEGAGTGVFQ